MGTKYRADIDGLRAIGVGSVVLFHAFPTALRGGFIGVDIFFVISGFLISGIIFNDHAHSKFSLLDFYIRRTRRIFPALLLVLLTTVALGYTNLLTHELTHLGKHLWAGTAFVSNLVLSSESGYFGRDAEENPLLHLWSLGVEEQFYLFWPLLIMAVWKKGRALLYSLVTVCLLSFALNIYQSQANPDLAFYLPFSRLWELLIGASLAYANQFHGPQLTKWMTPKRDWVSALGLVALLAGFVVIHRWRVFPGWWALVPSLGCAAIIAAGPAAWVNRTILSHRVPVFLGLISYPLYLWHWPILVNLNIASLNASTPLARLLAVALAVVMAWLTYRFLELPLRRIKSGRKAASGLVVLMTGVAAMGVAIHLGGDITNGGPRSAEKAQYMRYFGSSTNVFDYIRAEHIPEKYRYDCDFYPFSDVAALKKSEPQDGIPASCTAVSKAHQIFLWGDSHAQQYNFGLHNHVADDWDVLQVASSGCQAAVSLVPSTLNYCDHSNWYAIETIKRLRPSVVLIAQANRHAAKNLDALAQYVLALGVKHVIVMGPAPTWTASLPTVVTREHWDSPTERESRFLSSDSFAVDAELKAYFRGNQFISYVSVIDALCNAAGCLTRIGSDAKRDITSWDYGHLTPRTSDMVVERTLVPLLRSVSLAATSP